MKIRFFVIILSALIQVSGCNSPPKDMTSPQGAYAMYLNAIAEGNGDAAYNLLKKEVKTEIDETLANLKKTARLIDEKYPAVLKEKALREHCPNGICRAEDSGKFLEMMMKYDKGIKMSFTEQLGARIKKIYNDKGIVRITTVAGDVYNFEKGGDEKYYYIPGDDDLKAIGTARIKSREALLIVEKEIEALP
ncbi:MAG: hypothetical protein FJ088_08360 [Deltaproteobacteria bacterium]|nr:hypothetical protein [Deltaproteobacteria bacterium]